MKSKIHAYEAEGLVVEYDVIRCIHAAECVHGLPSVFDPDARPWIQPENAAPDIVANIIARCPTGALQARRPDGRVDETPDAHNTARPDPDGPLYIRGRIRLELPDGTTTEETRIALCRCGASRNKPLCDNSHVDIEFSDPGTGIEANFDDDGTGDGPVTITLVENGPALVSGPIRVMGNDGETADGEGCAFCRCGQSGNKPFCDGSHKRTGFEAEGTPR